MDDEGDGPTGGRPRVVLNRGGRAVWERVYGGRGTRRRGNLGRGVVETERKGQGDEEKQENMVRDTQYNM